MGNEDKLRNKGEEIGGAAKEKVGQATNNRDLEAEGKADQTGAKVKNAGEHVKDAVNDVKDGLKK